jgi:peptidoglycan/LPS O-acetylase OafA/YrhL
MLKKLVFIVVLVCCSTALFAQSPSAPVQPSGTPSEAGAVLIFNGWYLPRYQPKGTEADTTGALLSMFRRRRAAGWLYTVPFIVGMSLALPISSTDNYGQTTVAEEAISPPLGTAIIGGTVVGFIMHATMLNKAHLRAVDLAYAAGTPIPAKYRRRLNANHFAEAAYIREALRQQMEREQLQSQTPPR